ncbi:MAG: NAD(P)H-binding protein, partial [Deltaproteobacteria bacterium]|nr:NAD(P)H-binding protein [Deltaproteobacteria bacterium]
MRTVVTGASGFIGAKVITALAGGDAELVVVSRSPPRTLPASARWKGADLFSASSTAEVLEGADTAVYLVHSMMPSTRLFQGTFHDTDLLLADNFARSCVEKGVRRIVYLGGLVPAGHMSPHLQSRLEVGEVLRDTGIPVTELRAGMIVGPGGSSFEILKTLVERLPV